MNGIDAQCVKDVHDQLLPPAVQALIRQRMQMLEKLSYDPKQELKLAKIPQSKAPPNPSPEDILTLALQSDQPHDLIAIHASLTMLAGDLHRDPSIKVPDKSDGDLLLWAMRRYCL